METWLEKRSIHAVNLRSVFTAEQQRILERYYESGMTNQSKSCFQLILQCAQETKLDFSVVRVRLLPSFMPHFISDGLSCLCCIYGVMSDMSAPWLHSSSRKRPLQDRTQFSDRDVYTLKRYWDHGMTSLGSLCREKISAAASELRVDTEIITTWIGNRRRKYRLMGIEIPPPKGGPVVFPDRSPHVLEDERQTPERGEASEHSVVVSIMSSNCTFASVKDGASDLYLTENDDVNDESDGSTPAKHVKIEIVDEDDDDGDMLTTEMEQMQNLFRVRNEEVQFLEKELQSQKQKFSELKRSPRSLLIAVKNKDRTKQQQLLASLPQRVRALGLENNHSESGAETPTRESSVSEEEEDTDQTRL
ncbi:LOW QUALITY PROTEIN: highly divergent homeobox-like [Cyprinus carpio]|uniref:LOW QUALITY PROTEIN: highly divergent homeobox-like n=1 Tax=Cyprinus carpio TaxID=7962 RepID=A0A9Q9X1Z2_CYPCA|nr:LOW QUALITY PROTEIN: highly divergent homeobox-like [Cyprinus carpio]